MKKYIDLHMHTVNSDGINTVEEIINKAKALNLCAISITDHNNIAAYKNLDIKNCGIEIIRGVEIASIVNKIPVEILCYGYNVEKMEEFLKHNTISHAQDAEIKARRLKELFGNMGIKLNFDCDNFNYADTSTWSICEICKELYNNNEAVKLLSNENPELVKSYRIFFRHALNNRDSKFYVDMSDKFVSLEKLTNFAKESGFLTFLAHPCEYNENMCEILDVVKNFVDGIEVYHPSADAKKQKFLEKFCKINNLLMSGGSDYHGKKGQLNSERVSYNLLKKIKNRIN